MQIVPDWNLIHNRNGTKVDLNPFRFCFKNLVRPKAGNKPQGF